MKKNSVIFVFLLFFQIGNSQDIGITAINTSPSGCSLTSSENIGVSILNNGATDLSNIVFDVSYTINGGSAVSNLSISFPVFGVGTTVTYTFTTQANMSTAGTYTLSATATLSGDINALNNTLSGQLVTNTSSVGGIIAGAGSVCIAAPPTNINSGTLTLSGHTGTILNWESSTDGGTSFLIISNTSTIQPYNNLAVPTIYRARVQSGSCAQATSAPATMLIDPLTIAGTVSGSATKCLGSANGSLNLTGQTGSVTGWELSTNGGTSWSAVTPINTSSTLNYSGLLLTTKYRATVQSGVCTSKITSIATVTISPASVGGTISPLTSSVCKSSNGATLTLSGKTGSVVRWESSTNGGTTWLNITNTATTLIYSNITTTTQYRALVQSSPCASAFSNIASVNVTPPTVAGSVSADTSVCSGINSGALNLLGNSGSVVNWRSSVDGGATFVTIPNTATSLIFSNIVTTTIFDAIVKDGPCAAATALAVTVTAVTPSAGGLISAPSAVCVNNANDGDLLLSAETGSVINWLSSNNNGLSWTNIPNPSGSNTYHFNLLTDTTLFLAIVQNGVCPADSSDTVTVAVDIATNGGTLSSSANACFGNNSDTIVLTGITGTIINWESSINGGATWVAIVNQQDSLAYNNLTATTIYHAAIKSGVCPQLYSSEATITIDPEAAGGAITGGTTVCQTGNAGALILNGYTSSVSGWEYSIDGGLLWTAIANTTSQQPFSNISQTTMYRSIVSSGSCPNDTSLTAIITIDSLTVGGAVTLSDTVCAGQNSGVLSISGSTGIVTGWEMSTDGGTTWIIIANALPTQGYNNLIATTSYRAQVKNGDCGAIVATAATITVDQAAIAGIVSSNATVCEFYNSGTLLLGGVNGTVTDWLSSSDNGLSWTSLGVASNQYIYSSLTDTTWFVSVAVNGVCNADTSSPAVITVISKPATSFTKNDSCFGVANTFTNTTTVLGGFIQSFNWDFGDNSTSTIGSPTHMYADTGTFQVSLVTLSNFGCIDTFVLTTTVKPLPSVDFITSAATTFCNGDSISISVALNPNNSYLWNNNISINTIVVDTTGTWNISVFSSLTGCSNTNTISTIVLPAVVANAGTASTIGLGNSISLNGSGGTSYSWQPTTDLDVPSIFNPVASPDTTTLFLLTVTSSEGCSASASVLITVEPRYEFEIATVITPNGDGFNDFWHIKNIEYYKDNEVTIFNRYGQKVFGMTGYDNSWAGTSNNAALPDGTYYYVLKFSLSEKTFNGGITILNSK